MEMGLRVAKEKLWMVLHLRQLGETTLAGSIYREQVVRGWPGLAQEVKEICRELQVEDANETNLDKDDYEQLVELACMVKMRKCSENKQKTNINVTELCKNLAGKKTIC